MNRTKIYSFWAFAALSAAFLLLMAADPAFAQTALASGDECKKDTLGGMICNFINNTSRGPGIITGFAYMAGVLCGFLGILKLKAHVESPQQHPMWDSMKRFLAGGAFFALPLVANAVQNTMRGQTDSFGSNTGFSGKSSGVGLDAMIVKLMSNILEPTIWAVGWLGWIAGLIFVFIGISRLMKSEQDGPRGPSGIGTIMTFVVAGCLFSLNSIITYITTTIFGSDKIMTNGVLQYTAGLGGSSEHVHAVISAIIGFSILIGWISLVRGLFILRGVSEGNSQASMMAAVTHLIGGVLAINLGGVITAVQATLGITSYGIDFSGGGSGSAAP